MLVLLAAVAGILPGGMVYMALLGVWTGPAMVVICDVIAATPTVVPVFVVFDRVRVGGSVIESKLWLLGVLCGV